MTLSLDDARISVHENTVAFVLEVPRSQIILLQVFFELYDGVGTVRTLEVDKGIVCVMTTPSLEEDCRSVLMGIREQVSWLPRPASEGIDLLK
jgi:hypothetical protein